MPNALQAAGSQGRKQTSAAPIFVNRMFTGLWTQRNPLRDAATQYLVEKFYTGARFDSLIDGLNVELTARLTLKRRCGSSPYNTQSFPAIQRFYEFRRNFNNVESIQVIADTAGTVYDATGPSTKTALFTKSSTAGQSYFQSVGNTLYLGDGVDQTKIVEAPPWVASQATEIGALIRDSNGNLQYLNAMNVGTIVSVEITGAAAILNFSATNFAVTGGMSFTPSGLTGAAFLNGKLLIAQTVIPSGSGFKVTAIFVNPSYAQTTDSGTATTTDVETPAVTGTGTPGWNGTVGGNTTDALLTWKNFGNTAFNWTPKAPTNAPTIGPIGAYDLFFWQPLTHYGSQLIMDGEGNIQQSDPPTGSASGTILPTFSSVGQPIPSDPTSTGSIQSQDASMSWLYCGSIQDFWVPGQTLVSSALGSYVIVDSNGNLQQVALSGGATGTTGSTAPTWSTAFNGTTTDNTVTWINRGPALALAFSGWKYGYAFHCIDGTVTSISPASPLTNAVLAGVVLNGQGSGDAQVDSVWLFRTLDGGSTYQFLVAIANPGATGTWSYTDQNPDGNLNIFVEGPQADSNDPPPLGLINLSYHLGRVLGSVGNTMFYSAGPDTATGNGSTAWPPGNNFVLPAAIKRFLPLTQGCLIFTTSGVYFSANGGPNGDLPTEPAPYMEGKVGGLLGYNSLDVVGSSIYLINSKRMAKQIDIGSGESEAGFPIGDVLAYGNGTYPAINPATCYVSYHEENSTDCGLYLAQPGAALNAWWYRMNPTPAPETGLTWSPLAVNTQGYSAVQSIETSPGIHQLLMGPPVGGSGPILFRDPTTFADNGTPYIAYADIGSLVIAQPGQVGLVYFVTTDCVAIGSRPKVSVLVQEIGGHLAMVAKGAVLSVMSPDPPELGPAESTTIYNDRWWMSSTQQPALMRHAQWEFYWPAENEPNELLTYTLFGEHYQET